MSKQSWSIPGYEKVTRLTVIDHTKNGKGIVGEYWNVGVEVLPLQDNGRTLKIRMIDLTPKNGEKMSKLYTLKLFRKLIKDLTDGGKECSKCHGRGHLHKEPLPLNAHMSIDFKPCPECGGQGE